uniref:Beta-defensin-like domain-containing protein n=1 Tax=Gopherus agassizii TaxID=38772 RepID=A0A452J6R2_9SAUR
AMQALYLLFALLFLVFQEQAQSKEQDEPQEPLTGNFPVPLLFVNGKLPDPSVLFAEISSSCLARGGQCRLGFCPWKETKITSCGFGRPCCKKVI